MGTVKTVKIYDKSTQKCYYDPTDQEIADFDRHGSYDYREPAYKPNKPTYVEKRKLKFDRDSDVFLFTVLSPMSVLLGVAFVGAVIDANRGVEGALAGAVFAGILIAPCLVMALFSRPRWKTVRIYNEDYNPYRINPFT